MASYFFVCQFSLSRGHADAYRKDWRIVLALVAPLVVLTSPMLVMERREVILAQGSAVLLGCAGAYAGAVVASLIAKRATVRSSG